MSIQMHPFLLGHGTDLEKALECFERIQESISNIRRRLAEEDYISAAFELGKIDMSISFWSEEMNTVNKIVNEEEDDE